VKQKTVTAWDRVGSNIYYPLHQLLALLQTKEPNEKKKTK